MSLDCDCFKDDIVFYFNRDKEIYKSWKYLKKLDFEEYPDIFIYCPQNYNKYKMYKGFGIDKRGKFGLSYYIDFDSENQNIGYYTQEFHERIKIEF